jgi:hypothetical protein
LNRSSSEGVADYDGTKSNDTDYNGTKSNDTDYNGTKSNETNFDGTTTSDPNDLVTKEKHRFNRSRDTLANNVENVRSTRSKGNWKDGTNGAKDTEFWSGKQKFKAKLCLINDIKNPHGPFRILAMKASIRTALKNKERRDSIIKSIEAEIDNLEQPGVLTPTRFKNIPHEYRKHIIGVYMFHKEKFKADGTFDKDKMRLVLLSNLRDPDTIGDSFSPTVNPISVMTQLNLAAANKGTVISAYDIKGAFLLTPMKPGVRMFIKVNPDVAEHWISRCPHRVKWLQNDGCLYFELNRYVYGLHEASTEFNNLIDKQLQENGFMPTKADRCLYTKHTEDGLIILSIHVDDMLLTCPSIHWRTWFENTMEKHFSLVKQHDSISYLGMQIYQDEITGDILINQHGFLLSLIKKHDLEKLNKFPVTPAMESLTDSDLIPNTSLVNKNGYLSLVMSLMYLARFTRPDINFAVSYLATKSSSPTIGDEVKLKRVLRYLAGTPSEGIKFSGRFRPYISADASHYLYPEGHGQMGMIISNGSAPVAHRSVKIKMITRSSAESELCSLEEASTYAVWYILLLSDLGIKNVKPITIFQDNKSTIIMAIQGATFKRTKHIIGRQSYVRERILDGDIVLKYLKTADMTADILTKPTSRLINDKLKEKLFIVKTKTQK